MKHITIVVPVWNEENNIQALISRIDLAFQKADFSYDILFVDDHSTDKTTAVITRLKKTYPISLEIKQGKKGKAYSLCEGIRKADGDIVAILDADLQYPPEAIPKMASMLTRDIDIVVANRIKQKTSFARQFISSSFKKIFGNFLFGLNHDIQAGLKVFKKDICQHIAYHPSSGWTFDLEFLLRASQAGFVIENYDIEFSERAHGKSKVSFLKTSVEIGMNALMLKTKPLKPVIFHPSENNSMRGAGIGYKKKKYITHSTLSHTQSALTTITTPQRVFVFSLLAIFLIALSIHPLSTLQVLIGILSFVYFVDTVFNFFLVMKSLHVPQEITSTEQELKKIDTRLLPLYTILCPLYKEAHVIPQFLEAIEKLDYPKNKLDVLLLLEEDDADSISKVERMYLPPYVRSIVVPHSMPKTKPKACNYGLSFAKGEYLVIYDAEDAPDPLQLKKAYLGFQKVGAKVLCLQAKLNYYNPHQNLLTRFFTAEYSLWFDVTLTGLQAAETSIPLGGTSNHFRTKDLLTLQGWDPFNVTEDADLGIRLFKRGYKTAIIDSVTLEEANSNVFNWIRQRSRWIKGYMQTYLVHTRSNFGLTHKNFLHSLFFHLNIGGKIAFILINPFLWMATISYFVLYRFVGPTIESLYPSYVFYMALISLVFGNFMFIYYYMIGAAKREQWSLIKYVYLIPFYWLLISWSGFIAFYQLIFKPHYWEKTIHGLHLGKLEKLEQKEKREFIPSFIQLKFFPLYLPKIAFKKIYETLHHEKLTTGGIFIASNAVASIFTFIFSVYLGRTLSFEDFSLVSLINGLIATVALIYGALGTTMTYKTSYLVGKDGEDAAVLFWAKTRKGSFFIAYGIAGIWILLSPLLQSYFNLPNVFPILLFTPILLFNLAASADKSVLFSKLNFKVLSLLTILEPFLRVLLAYALLRARFHSWTYVSIPVAAVSAFIVGWFFVRKYWKEASSSLRPASFPFKFFLVSLISGFSAIIFLSFDVILAKHYLSPSQAGLYALTATIGKMFFFLASLAAPFTIPLVSRNEGASRDSSKFLQITVAAILLVTIPPFTIFLLFGQFVVPLIFGARAIATVQYLPIVTFSLICFSIARVYADYYLAKKYYSFNALPLLLGGITLLVLSRLHSSVLLFVDVMSVAWIVNLLLTLVLHIFSEEVGIFERNIVDFFDVFFGKKFSEGPSVSGIRILIFNWRDTKHTWAGGAEVYLHELAKRWVAEGNSVTLFCGNDGSDPKNETIDGVKVVRRGGFYMVYVWAFFYYIFRFRGKFDVIIDSENGIPFFAPIYIRKPIFLLIHHVHQDVFRKSLKKPFAMLAEFLELYLMPFVYRNVQVITVSPSSKEEILRHKLTKKEPIIIYNGVNLQEFRPSKKSPKPLVVYVGRLQYYKSINVFIKAAKKILDTVPTIQFAIAGDGGEKYRLQQYAIKLGLKDKIIFLGKIAHDEKIRLFQKAWVFVNPSFMEGWGITTIEANACGTPAVASNVPGLRDSIKNPHTGFLVPYGNSDGFAEKILNLITDKKLREEFSKESILWASHFSWDRSSQQFFTILLQATEEKKHTIRLEYTAVIK